VRFVVRVASVRRSTFALAELLLDPRVFSLGECRGLSVRAPAWNGDADRACIGDADQIAAGPGVPDENQDRVRSSWFRVQRSRFRVRGSGFEVER
jgi:hypothetical protein